MSNEPAYMLGGLALVIAFILELFTWSDPHRSIGSEVLRSVGEERFSESCDIYGAPDAKGHRNCFDSGGYRFWRYGLRIYVGKIAPVGKPVVEFASGTDNTVWWGLDWRDAYAALHLSPAK